MSVFLPADVKISDETCRGRQSQLARMTSDLCEDGGDKQREKETPAASKASSVSPSPVTASVMMWRTAVVLPDVSSCCSVPAGV